MACLWYRIAYPERMGKLGLATPGLAQVLPSCSPTCCNKYKYLCVSSRSILSPSCLFVCLFWHPKELRRPSIEKRQILKPYDQQRLVFTSTGLLNGTSGTAWWLVSAGNVLQTLSEMGVDRTFSRILDSPSQFCHPVVSGSFAWDELWWGLQKPPLDHCCRNICTCILLSWAKVSPLKTIFFPIQASSVCMMCMCVMHLFRDGCCTGLTILVSFRLLSKGSLDSLKETSVWNILTQNLPATELDIWKILHCIKYFYSVLNSGCFKKMFLK